MPLCDRKFDVGVPLISEPFPSDPGTVIGVEATSYLQQIIDDPPSHEPLLAALGGDPIGLKQHLENELNRWKDNNMRPLFVFDGLNVVGKDEIILEAARVALQKTNNAWTLYGENQPAEAVSAFGASGAVRASELYRILQEVLLERDLEFMIAPYSAGPQLAYLLNEHENGNAYIDSVMGSRELLLYNIDPLILPITPADWENKSFRGLSKEHIIDALNIDHNRSPDFLEDALLMAGTSFLPTFPALLDTEMYKEPPTLLNILNLLRAQEKSVDKASRFFEADLKLRDPKWYDKYMKAKMGLRHPVTMTLEGAVITKEWDKLTGDNNQYLGLQLPPELHFYLSTALVGPRTLNYFVSLKSVVFPTLDGVTSDEYKRLVTRALVPVKETTAALIGSRLHRGFQYNDIEMRFWFDEDAKQTLVHRNMQTQVNQKADTWGVNDALLSPHKGVGRGPGTLSFALLSLQIENFPRSTISRDKVTGLNSKSEVISNALWRLLHLRGYVNDQHELTAWGRALATTMKSIGPTVNKYNDIHHIEEAAFLAFELLRFDNLNSRNRHSELIGGPLRGSEEDKANCILIGRTACLLKLRHQNIGYTGPLSKNFLSFHSIIKAVREIDRDLLEAVTASMFLSNQASRERTDKSHYRDLGRSLQFSKDIDTALGIAVKTYLDDFLKLEWSVEERKGKKAEYVQRYLPHSFNFEEDLDVAFKFFDAVYDGVRTFGDEISDTDKNAWDAAKVYLDKRR